MKKKKKSIKVRYFEFSVPAFFDVYPDVVSFLPPAVVFSLLSEPEYIVRVCPSTGQFEFGFSDDDWEVLK